jgi:hypothetical protein
MISIIYSVALVGQCPGQWPIRWGAFCPIIVAALPFPFLGVGQWGNGQVVNWKLNLTNKQSGYRMNGFLLEFYDVDNGKCIGSGVASAFQFAPLFPCICMNFGYQNKTI